MKLKVDQATGKAEVQNGHPVYVYDDGKEVAVDVPATVAKFTKLSEDIDAVRKRAVTAEDGLKAFEGLDPKSAREAAEKLKDLERKKLVDSGEVDKVKAEVNAIYEGVLGWPLAELKERLNGHKTVAEAITGLAGQVRKLTVGAKFATDPHFVAVADKKPKTLLPPDIAEQVFGGLFEPTAEGRITAKFPDGTPVRSRTKPGELADFDEAIGLIVDNYAHKDSILRDPGGAGVGAGGGANANGHPTDKSTEGLPPEDRLARAWSGGGVARR